MVCRTMLATAGTPAEAGFVNAVVERQPADIFKVMTETYGLVERSWGCHSDGVQGGGSDEGGRCENTRRFHREAGR